MSVVFVSELVQSDSLLRVESLVQFHCFIVIADRCDVGEPEFSFVFNGLLIVEHVWRKTKNDISVHWAWVSFEFENLFLNDLNVLPANIFLKKSKPQLNSLKLVFFLRIFKDRSWRFLTFQDVRYLQPWAEMLCIQTLCATAHSWGCRTCLLMAAVASTDQSCAFETWPRDLKAPTPHRCVHVHYITQQEGSSLPFPTFYLPAILFLTPYSIIIVIIFIITPPARGHWVWKMNMQLFFSPVLSMKDQ